jgi:ribulose-phosphate 3-epimerase
MTEIAPSILSADFSNLQEEIKKVVTARYLHLDVMDGIFVPNLTFGPGLIKAIRPHTNQVFDTHLMMVHPERYIEFFAKAGSDIITVHAEVVDHLDRVIEQIKETGCQACVALNPATPLNTLDYILDKLDMVLLMTVNPGFGGQEFIPGMYNKIKDLRRIIDEKSLDVLIEIDGGVNIENIKEIARVGVDVIVTGSAVFKADNPTRMLDRMKREIAEDQTWE